MKAAVYYQNGGPEVFHYKVVVDPGCGPDEVLIRVEAISVEGGDLVNRELRPLARVPHVAGYQCAGAIIEVGRDVLNRRVGDRVVAVLSWGPHAQYARLLQPIHGSFPKTLRWIRPPQYPWRGVPHMNACSLPAGSSRLRRC
jgi:NADPH:quinone reductase-like Zn-dependent oxidoreductase